MSRVNIRGVFLCMKYELQLMRKQSSGAIVNCSSNSGLVGVPGRAAYATAKHGMLGLTKCTAIDYAPKGIRINAVCPGTISTPMVMDMFKTGDLQEALLRLWHPATGWERRRRGSGRRALAVQSVFILRCRPGHCRGRRLHHRSISRNVCE